MIRLQDPSKARTRGLAASLRESSCSKFDDE